MWCASGAGAGSAATEPRSRAASGLGAPAPLPCESRPQRSAAQWRTPPEAGLAQRARVGQWPITSDGVLVGLGTAPLGVSVRHAARDRRTNRAARPASASAQHAQRAEARGIGAEIGRDDVRARGRAPGVVLKVDDVQSGSGREDVALAVQIADVFAADSPAAKRLAQIHREEAAPPVTRCTGDLPHRSGCESRSRCAVSRMRARSWTRTGPRGSSLRGPHHDSTVSMPSPTRSEAPSAGRRSGRHVRRRARRLARGATPPWRASGGRARCAARR